MALGFCDVVNQVKLARNGVWACTQGEVGEIMEIEATLLAELVAAKVDADRWLHKCVPPTFILTIGLELH